MNNDKPTVEAAERWLRCETLDPGDKENASIIWKELYRLRAELADVKEQLEAKRRQSEHYKQTRDEMLDVLGAEIARHRSHIYLETAEQHELEVARTDPPESPPIPMADDKQPPMRSLDDEAKVVSHWECPNCGASYGECGDPDKAKQTECRCHGFVCACGPVDGCDYTHFFHGMRSDHICSHAECEHCGWCGTMPHPKPKR